MSNEKKFHVDNGGFIKLDVDDGFIVPIMPGQKRVTEEERGELLKNFQDLKNLTSEEIYNVWDEIYYNLMVKKLEAWYEWEPLKLDFAEYLLKNKHLGLLIDNIWKFEEAQRREIVFMSIWAMGGTKSEESVRRLLVNNGWIIDKEIAIHLIQAGFSGILRDDTFHTTKLDMEIVNELKNNKRRLDFFQLDDFIEEDRKNVALEMIYYWWNPDFSLIPKEYLTKDFALEIINMDFRRFQERGISKKHIYSVLSKNIKLFDEETQKVLVLKYITAGLWNEVNENKDRSEVIYCKETVMLLIENWILCDINKFTWLDMDVINKLKEKHYNFNLKDLKLYNFIEEDRKYVLLEILRSWWEPDLTLVPEKDLTQDFALKIFYIDAAHAYNFLAKSRGFFDESTQKILAIKYIEAGQWKYIDAKWLDTIRWEDIAISLIDNWKEGELVGQMDSWLQWLDIVVINRLKEKGYDLKNLDKWLWCFIEETRKDIALEIIKAWWEPDLTLIPKKDLTQDFAQEIINLRLDNWLKVLSPVILFFDSSLVGNILLDLINAGWWKYLRDEILDTNRFDAYLDKKFMLAVLRSEGVVKAWEILKKFTNLDSEVALAFIKAGGTLQVVTNLRSFGNLDDKVAKSLIKEGYKDDVQENKERFSLGVFTKFYLSVEKQRKKQREKKREKVGDNILQELMDFCNEWEDGEDLAVEPMKAEIIKAAKKISRKVKRDSDWSQIFTFKLKNRELQILFPWLENYTDDKFKYKSSFGTKESAFSYNNKSYKYHVELWWMRWDNVDNWENEKLKKYVKKKIKQWFHIPSVAEMVGILSEFWESGGLKIDDERKDLMVNENTSALTAFQMILFMILTASPWWYRLSGWNLESSENQEFRPMMHLFRGWAMFEKYDYDKLGWFPGGIIMVK